MKVRMACEIERVEALGPPIVAMPLNPELTANCVHAEHFVVSACFRGIEGFGTISMAVDGPMGTFGLYQSLSAAQCRANAAELMSIANMLEAREAGR